MATKEVQSNGSSAPLAYQEFGSDDSGFRRRLASVKATEEYFGSLARIMTHIRALEDSGILDGQEIGKAADMVQNTFRQDHPVLEVDETIPTIEDFTLNVNDEVLSEKLDQISKARKRADARTRKWEEAAP